MKSSISLSEYGELGGENSRSTSSSKLSAEITLAEASNAWVDGKMGTFDYLTLLNKVRGKKLYGLR